MRSAGNPLHHPTDEQQAILDAVATGETTAIRAAAGTGKTSTLRMIAAARSRTRMLYVAYNKAVQVEADRSFGHNVTCKTAHALAYRQFGAPMSSRLNGPRRTGAENAKVLGIRSAFGFNAERVFPEATLASMAMGMVSRFCRSSAPSIEPGMLSTPEGVSDDEARALAQHVLPYARKAWLDLTAGPVGQLKPTHDVYLKQWQLSGPELTGWDVILYDEAQDADPCISDVVERQRHAQLVAVGDSAQAIYGWRGAGDFLGRVNAPHRLQLTQSWRFGQAVADEANVWLSVVGTDMRVRGNPGRDSRLDTLIAPDAVLCRTNAGTIDQLLAAHEAGTRVHLVGDGWEVLSLARAAQRLQNGESAGHPELVAFSSWEQVIDYAEHDPAGNDLAVAARLIDRYGPDDVIRAIEGAVPPAHAELIVSTCHKSKGLEWGKVRIGTDFVEPVDKQTGKPLPIPAAEAMLAYVAVTRARDVLDNDGLAWVHPHLEALGPTPAAPAVTRTQVTQPAPEHAAPGGRSEDELRLRWETARAYAERSAGRPSDDPLVHLLRDQGDAELVRLQPELAALRPEHPKEAPGDTSAGAGVAVGTKVLVAGERGIYTVRGVGKDGSLTCYPATQAGSARSFRPEWVTPAERAGRGGKLIRVRSVPAAANQAREAWEIAHGFRSRRDDPPVVSLDLGIT